VLTPRDPAAFKADVLRRAVRIDRRRRRMRVLTVAAAVAALLASTASFAVLRARDSTGGVDLTTAGQPVGDKVRTRALALPDVHSPRAIAGDGDTSLWVLDRGGDRPSILRFDGGRLAATARLPADAAPEQIVSGTDRGLWMTDPAASRVLRVTREGKVTIVPVGGTPSATAVFAGERLWFGERAAGRLTSVDPSGKVDHRALPAGTAPDIVAPGPDGSIWYGDASRAVIGSVSATGRHAAYDLASPDERVVVMTIGPGPALWLLVRSDRGLRVGRVDGAARIVEDDVETSSATRGLTQGPDGRLWFTSSDGTRLYRTSLSDRTSTALDRPVRARSWAGTDSGGVWALDTDRNEVVELVAP
jgi:virginiamycin B lyase